MAMRGCGMRCTGVAVALKKEAMGAREERGVKRGGSWRTRATRGGEPTKASGRTSKQRRTSLQCAAHLCLRCLHAESSFCACMLFVVSLLCVCWLCWPRFRCGFPASADQLSLSLPTSLLLERGGTRRRQQTHKGDRRGEGGEKRSLTLTASVSRQTQVAHRSATHTHRASHLHTADMAEDR